MVRTIGVLALQGDYQRHLQTIEGLGHAGLKVRYPRDLNGLDGLIIPGGESTTISKQLDSSNLRRPLLEFAQHAPVFGTCAGLILMSRKAGDARVHELGLLDLEVDRNSWGPQVYSFTADIMLGVNGRSNAVPGVFIRAPRILSMGADVRILATYQDEPALVQQGRCMGATFHPELTKDTKIHQLFLDLIGKQ